MSLRIIGTIGTTVALISAVLIAGAQAQTFYIGGEGGWTHLQGQKDRFLTAPPTSGRARFDEGFAAGARAGYEMGPWRFEEEYTYRRNGLDRLSVGGANIAGARGSRQAHAIMTNLLYDFDLGWPVTPHIGAGIGAVYLVDRAGSPAGRLLGDHSWQLGYQAIGGIRYNLSPALAVDLDYRYLATTDATFRTPTTPQLRYRTGYNSHNVLASLTYRFGPPPPPVVAPPVAAPLPAPVQRRVFLVFFDWDRATITADGLQIIRQAAAAYKSGAPVQIQVTGYTDRSGSPGYNQRLSERRATAVADGLVRLGVPRNDMMVSGRGENDNRVPTAAGVREPQNRRVEIVFP
jgi:OmpA-OmpF porin, OOP family